MIDRARWGRHAGHPLLGAADYKLVHHASNGRAVYSFCMCPGGTVVAATSEPNRVVTNGMSQYSRNERNANAGMVVSIDPADYPGGPAGGQCARHRAAARTGIARLRARRRHYEAPGQLVGDFVAGKPSTAFGDVLPSYKPGVKLGDLHPSPAAVRHRGAARGLPGLRPQDPRASTATTPCSPASRPAPRRRCASRAATISRA
jgi:uncharacterized FAD-dependent dehydrogenase